MNCKHFIKSAQTVLISGTDPGCPWCEIERLRECLEWLDRRGGLGLDIHETIRKVLDGP